MKQAEQNLISTGREDDGKTDAPVLSHQAMWENEIQVYELQKGYSGLGFSVLDYQVCVCVCLCTKTMKRGFGFHKSWFGLESPTCFEILEEHQTLLSNIKVLML